MTEPRRFGLLDLILFLLVLSAAAGVRGWYLHEYADDGASAGPLQVQDEPPLLQLPPGTEMNGQSPPRELDALLHNLKEHQSFTSLAPFAAEEEQTAHVAPGYVWLRAWLETVPGLPTPIDQTLRWLQCGLGALTAGLYFLFALRAFRSRLVALLAGLLCSVHPFWVVNTAELNDGVLATFLLAACLFLGAGSCQAGSALTSLLYGLALTGLALVRAALLPFAFVALLAFLVRCRRVPGGWFPALLTFLGFTIGLAPWTIRNYQVFEDLVPLVTTSHLHLYMGNNPSATGGPQSEQALLEALAKSRDESPEQTAQALAELHQPARYRELGKAAFEDIQTNIAGTLQRRLWAGLYFLFGEQFFKDQRLWRGGGTELPEGYPAVFYAALLVILPLGLLGWRWSYPWRQAAMPSSLAFLWVPLPYLLTHGHSLCGPRLPFDGLLITWSAFALACLVPAVARSLFAGPPPATVDVVPAPSAADAAPTVPDRPNPFA